MSRDFERDQMSDEHPAEHRFTLETDDIEEQYSFDPDALARRQALVFARSEGGQTRDVNRAVVEITQTGGLNGAGVHLFAAALKGAVGHHPASGSYTPLSSGSEGGLSPVRSRASTDESKGTDIAGHVKVVPHRDQIRDWLAGSAPRGRFSRAH
mmetsp:Transcript_22680/g.39895  ORF Transcript_22680/g.39895 Transcript_22680/m.39895 type:complete len:154 (+) Transcript_22680:61-522(+)